jgi:hypothetical protein
MLVHQRTAPHEEAMISDHRQALTPVLADNSQKDLTGFRNLSGLAGHEQDRAGTIVLTDFRYRFKTRQYAPTKRIPLSSGAGDSSLTAAPCAPGVSIPEAAAGPRVGQP